MDTDRFDALTRTLASGTSRRTMLRRLLGSALGGTLAVAGLQRGSAAPKAKVTICHWDQDRGVYDQITISAAGLNGHRNHPNDLLMPDFSSPETCGDCNTACAGTGSCIDGHCTLQSSGCDDGLTECGERCLDTRRDRGNCGACGKICEPNQRCADGVCQCPADTAPECDSVGCVELCSSDESYYRYRFQDCHAGINSYCSDVYCIDWMGCYGEIDTQTDCGTVTAGCPGGD